MNFVKLGTLVAAVFLVSFGPFVVMVSVLELLLYVSQISFIGTAWASHFKAVSIQKGVMSCILGR